MFASPALTLARIPLATRANDNVRHKCGILDFAHNTVWPNIRYVFAF